MRFTEIAKLEPSTRARAVTDSLYLHAVGSIDRSHADFLLTLIETLDARKVVEIGVASGASSLYMLGMLKKLSGSRQLFSIDGEVMYYADASKPVGYLALESEFNETNRLVVEGGANSSDLRTLIAKHSLEPDAPVDFAFVDGNHRHPWPTIDFLFLIPLMREGGFVALHDINLPDVTGADKGFGPMKLFECPFETRLVEPGDRPNIGAIQIADKSRMIDLAIEALAKEWEISFGPRREHRILAEISGGPLSSRAAEIARHFESRRSR